MAYGLKASSCHPLRLHIKQMMRNAKHYLGEKRWVFVCFLKEAIVGDFLTATGKLFHTRGAAFWKAQSPNIVEVLLETSRGWSDPERKLAEGM